MRHSLPLLGHTVDVRGLEKFLTVAREVAIACIIEHYEDEVWLWGATKVDANEQSQECVNAFHRNLIQYEFVESVPD